MFSETFSQEINSVFADKSVIKDIDETIGKLFPNNRGVKGSFWRTYLVEEKPTIEISIFSNRNIIYDFVFDAKKRTTCIVKLTSSSTILLSKFYPDESDTNLSLQIDEPYRVELEINSEIGGVNYQVEGQAKTIKSLIDYYDLIMRSFRQIEVEK